MQTDLARVTLRGRQALEAVDLGFCMARAWWRPLLLTWLVFVVPLGAALAVALREHPLWAVLLLWWLRPVFDRVPLMVLARALFGERTRLVDVASALPALLRSGLGTSLFMQRLSPARTFLLPVLQLEGLRGAARRQRCSVLARRDIAAAMGLMLTGAHFNAALLLGLLFGIQFLVPDEIAWNVFDLLTREGDVAGEDPIQVLVPLLYLCGISVVEPLLVAGGFALYVNRRVYLEGWDIDLAFRGLADRVQEERRGSGSLRVAAGAGLLLALLQAGPATADPRCVADEPAAAAGCIEAVLGGRDFGSVEEVERWRLRDFGGSEPSLELDWLSEGVAVGVEIALWTGLALLVVLLVVVAARRLEGRGSEPMAASPGATTTLVGLDLDPGSLPDDIVGAARECWAGGAAIEALSLLYRGALLHLTDRGDLPIPESATELECLRLVKEHVADDTARVFSDLTDAWVRARYAAEPPGRARFEELCVRFRPSFGSAA